MDICHRIDPDCRACGKPVYWRKRIFYLDKLWHLDCFRCSRCKVQLNTEAEENDQKHSKGILGEDSALRCDKCNRIFEQKKLAKSTYIRRPDLLNNLVNDQIQLGQQSIKYSPSNITDHYAQMNYNVESREDAKKLIGITHKCYCVGHKCMRDRVGDHNINDRKCSSAHNQFIKVKRCSFSDQQCISNGKRCSNATDHLLKADREVINECKLKTDNRKELSSKITNSCELYRSLFKDKNLKCNCRCCKEYRKYQNSARTTV